MTDRRALTKLLVVVLVGLVLAAAPVRNPGRWSWPAAVEHATGDRASVSAEPDTPPSRLVEQATEVGPFKVAVTWVPLLAFLAAFAVRIPLPGRRLPRCVAVVHRHAVRERPRVPRAPPTVATTS